MKFIVDQIPEHKDDCPFARWESYPPCVEKIGDWYCSFRNRKLCDLEKNGCKWLKEYKSE